MNKNFEMQSKEAERRFKHEDWMEEQKRNLFNHKVSDLANQASQPTAPSVDNSVLTAPLDVDWKLKPTTLLNSVVLNADESSN